jgi:hypothetical protein
MRIHILFVAATLACIGLAGCASDQQATRSVGLTSGPLPAPQAFVVDSRPARHDTYLPVGVTPPARSDTVLSMDQRKALEASLLATPGRQPTPQQQADAKKGPKKKVVSNRKGVGFLPPK